jgi:hypothetical protein
VAAPAFGSAGTGLAYGARTNSSIPVPAGVAAGHIVLVHLYADDSSPTVTPPSGFTEITFSPTPLTTGPTSQQHIYWKRATGADSGTYLFTHAAANTQAVATRWTGCVTTGTPLEVLGSAQRTTAGTVTPAVSGTTAGADRLLVFTGTEYSSPTWTPPTGFTEAVDFESVTVDYKAQATAGATGSVSATASGSNAQTATLIGLLPVAGAPPAPGAGTASGTWTFTGTAVGKRPAKGSASGAWSFTGAAVGRRPAPMGSASGSFSYTGTAVGKRAPKATASGTWAFVGTAGAKTQHRGAATGLWAFVGAAVGHVPPVRYQAWDGTQWQAVDVAVWDGSTWNTDITVTVTE